MTTNDQKYVDSIEEMAKRLEKAGLLIPLLEPERAVELAIKCMKGGENNERSRD